MAAYDTIIEAAQKFLTKQIYKVTPSGAGMEKWKAWSGKESMLEKGARMRNFDVTQSQEPPELVAVGAGTRDYRAKLNIEVCYQDLDNHKVQAVRDFDEISHQVNNADHSTVQALGAHYFRFETMEFRLPEGDNEKEQYIFSVIPVEVYITVTH
jgi:hypothetical protein